VPAAAKPVWISAKGEKHRLDPATGMTVCGLEFKAPFPACKRSDPMCRTCTSRMR
jgi:hypothetical protein